MSAPMSREAVDETLAGLGAAHDRIAAAMFGIDSHPGLAYLRSGGLSGRTLARWEALAPEIDLLWSQFNVLGDLLERARGIRGQRRPDDADWDTLRLICGEPVVGLDATGMPVEAGGGAPATRLRLWDLANQIERRCATMAGHLSDVDSSFTLLAGRYGPVTQEVDALVAQARSIGLGDEAEPLAATLTDAARVDLGDPLSAAPGGRLSPAGKARFDELTARIARLRERVGTLVAIRDRYPHRVAELRALIDQIALAEQQLPEVYTRVRSRIEAAPLPPPQAASGVLRNRLAFLDRLYQEARWGRLVDDLTALDAAATRALGRLRELRDAAEGLLARRDELRGRLEAYRAKAARLGHAEHEQLGMLYARARDLLYTAPCDLRAATRAVFAYQQALAALPAGNGGDHDDR